MEAMTMARTSGYVGTLEVETRGHDRVWIGLTQSANDNDWIRVARKRAWFTLDLETADRPVHLAELALLKQALTEGLQVQVSHDGAAAFHKSVAGDAFDCTGVRVLRSPMHFS
jgi:hypothetical protein